MSPSKTKFFEKHYKRTRHMNEKKLIKSLNYVLVIKARHFDWVDRKNDTNNGIVLKGKAYNWQVTPDTFNSQRFFHKKTGTLKSAQSYKGRIATVEDGKNDQRSFVVILGLIKAKGSAVKAMAKRLKPVLNVWKHISNFKIIPPK